MSHQEIEIEDEKLKEVKNWLKPKSVCDIQVSLGFANFYQRFIQDFNKIIRLLTLLLKIISLIGLSTILQLLIDAADEDEFGESNSNKTNLSKPSTSKKSTRASYLIFKGTKKDDNNSKKGGGSIKKCVKATKGSNYLTPDNKKAFNHL